MYAQQYPASPTLKTLASKMTSSDGDPNDPNNSQDPALTDVPPDTSANPPPRFFLRSGNSYRTDDDYTQHTRCSFCSSNGKRCSERVGWKKHETPSFHGMFCLKHSHRATPGSLGVLLENIEEDVLRILLDFFDLPTRLNVGQAFPKFYCLLNVPLIPGLVRQEIIDFQKVPTWAFSKYDYQSKMKFARIDYPRAWWPYEHYQWMIGGTWMGLWDIMISHDETGNA